MKIELHAKAIENYDQKATKLIEQLRFKIQPKKSARVENPNIHVSGHFDNTNIIGELKPFWRDSSGNMAARGFYVRGKLIGLFDDDYKNLTQIAEDIQKKSNPKNVVGVELLSELIFEWIKQKYKGVSMPSMTEFVLAECEKQIEDVEIWIPIANLHLEVPFKVGNVTFKVITKNFMDEYETVSRSQLTNPEDIKTMEFMFERKRSEIQNRAVAIVKVEAEKDHAYEIASEETERAMSILRFFSVTNLYPTQTCYSAPIEKQHLDGDVYFVIKDGKVLHDVSGTTDKSYQPWVLRKKDLIEFKKTGLDTLSKLLVTETLTDFQQKLLEALFLYSKASLAKEISDRLIYTLVALETVFVKNQTEPLQDNISLRMAFMHPVGIEQRKEIITNIKDTYALRSSFIHHGKKVDIKDEQILKKFMWNTWISIQGLIPLAAKGITKEQFFEKLENRRIGG